jgi:5'-deoxynucleotidase YfbR-like HD superfamily hydrolase
MNWELNPELQKKYDEVVARISQLQIELGVKPRSIEERYQDYLSKKAEEDRRAEEIKKLQSGISKMRPPPKWKV